MLPAAKLAVEADVSAQRGPGQQAGTCISTRLCFSLPVVAYTVTLEVIKAVSLRNMGPKRKPTASAGDGSEEKTEEV